MKFGKKYQEYLEREALPLRLQGCSYVEFKRHKKFLKKCCHDLTFAHSCSLNSVNSAPTSSFASQDTDPTPDLMTKCFSSCTACEMNFFSNLTMEISAVVDCFNTRAQQLLNGHLASGFKKYLLWLKKSVVTDRSALIQEGKALVNYASMNGIAIRKILKKYDKVHSSEKGRAFRSRLQNMHVELLQSPWLVELAALYINLSDSTDMTALSLPVGFSVCAHGLDEEKPVIQCTLLGSLKLELDLTCSICLDTVFDPVSLACGHIFCNSCACSAAYVLILEGVKSADRAAKCPLCRLGGVYLNAVHLMEVNYLIKNRCKEYWEGRLRDERAKRLQEVKDHWEKQVQAVVGL